MFSYLIKAKETTLDILFPPICLNCGKNLEDKNRPICEKCLSLIKINSAVFCPVCRARLADSKKICHPKSKFILAPAGQYSDPILQNIIQTFKYKSVKNLAPVLGEIIIKYIKNCELSRYAGSREAGKIENSIIIPIPLHKSRERQRGFNQAKLIAEFISEHFNLPLVENLKRVKKTEPQAQMKNKEERQKNISGCFKIENPDSVKNKNIILIDDVFTTGDTINEAVEILKESGAKEIIVFVAASA